MVRQVVELLRFVALGESQKEESSFGLSPAPNLWMVVSNFLKFEQLGVILINSSHGAVGLRIHPY